MSQTMCPNAMGPSYASISLLRLYSTPDQTLRTALYQHAGKKKCSLERKNYTKEERYCNRNCNVEGTAVGE